MTPSDILAIMTKALIVVDHGSKVQKANDHLELVVSLLKQQRPLLLIEPAHMELAEPSISQAVIRCVEQGATHITVFAYMLSPGRHSTQDIPHLVEEALAPYPYLTYQVIPGFGLNPKLGEIIWDKTQL